MHMTTNPIHWALGAVAVLRSWIRVLLGLGKPFTAVVLDEDGKKRRDLALIGCDGTQIIPDRENRVLLPAHWSQTTVAVVDRGSNEEIARLPLVRVDGDLTRIVVPRKGRRSRKRAAV